jgi:hypothetical protein
MGNSMKRGIPRPWNRKKKMPIPYTSFSASNKKRVDECLEKSLCTICGLKLGETCSIALEWRDNRWQIHQRLEGQVHRNCARIAEGFCPVFGNPASYKYIHEVDTSVVGLLRDGEMLTEEELLSMVVQEEE